MIATERRPADLRDTSEIYAEWCQCWVYDGADVFVECRQDFVLLEIVEDSWKLDDLVLAFHRVATGSFEI